MKKLLVAVLAGCFLFSGVARAVDFKFASVDFEKVFNEYNKTKTEDAQLKATLDKKKAELEQKKAEVDKLREGLELLGEAARKEKEKEIRDKIKALADLRKTMEEDLVKERNDKWLAIYEEIKVVVAKYGKDKGYTVIFDDKALVYKAEGNDVTADVIAILNSGKK
jgi:Skp family chaperone for outer membrane proteins